MKTKLGALCLFVSCLLALACGPAASRPDGKAAAKQGGTLVYRVSAAPTTLNYLMASDEPTIIASFFLLNSRLVDFDPVTGKYVPALAESWKAATELNTFDVKLRDGLKFSDGSEITSEDVVFTLNAIYDPRTKSPTWNDSMLVNDKQIVVKAVDKLNLKFTFPGSIAGPENYLVNLGVLPSKRLKADFDAGRLAETWKMDADPKTIVTSGPFVVESATAGERLTLARNPNYWRKDAAGTQLPYLDKIVIEAIADANNAIARLNQNTVDIIDRLRPADYATLTAPGATIKPTDAGPGLGTDHIWFNLNTATAAGQKLDTGAKYAWFNDKRFRRAVSTAIDRETIAKTTLRGLATPLYGFVSVRNTVWADSGVPKTEYSLANAAKQLEDAGFVKKGTPEAPELFDAKGNRVEFTLVVQNENEPRKLAAAVIQEDLAKLGIKMTVAPVETADISKRWSTSFDYDAVLMGLSQSDLDPSSYANFLLSNASTHQWQPSQKQPATDWEKRIDELFNQQAKETDEAKRHIAFNEIQRIMADELPVIPVAARHVVSAANPRVGNYKPSTILPYALWNADEIFVSQ